MTQSITYPQREQLEYALVSGAAAYLAAHAHEAEHIAEGIKKVLDKLHPRHGEQAQAAKLPITDAMVGRFLSWALPEDFAPDCGITFTRSPHAGMNPTGTNLLHAGQARAMLEHCINGPFASPITLPVVAPGPDSLEREIQAKASNGPSVTTSGIEAEIVREHFFTAEQGASHTDAVAKPYDFGDTWASSRLDAVTFCVLVLRNGTKVVGVNYGAIDPAQHSTERGRQDARAQAVGKVYELLGFRLRDELARPVLTDADAAADLAGTQRPSQAGAGN